jgi:hypothetical protein
MPIKKQGRCARVLAGTIDMIIHPNSCLRPVCRSQTRPEPPAATDVRMKTDPALEPLSGKRLRGGNCRTGDAFVRQQVLIA